MKKLIGATILVVGLSTLGRASNVTDTGPGSAGDVLYFTGQAGNDQGTWSSLPALVQQVINNNVTVPATVGSGVNGAAPDTVGNLNFVGTGLTSSVSGSGSTAVSNVDFSNLSTVEGQTNATNISNVSNSLNTTNSNVTNLTNTVNSNSTDISGLSNTVSNHTTQINQNTSDISSLNTTVADHSAHLTTLDNGLAQEVVDRTNGDAVNASAITNETTRATGAETTLTNNLNTTNTNLVGETNRAVAAENNEAATRAAADTTLQNNINSEASTRASADQALQSQINNVNAQAQDNTNRIDRLEQTKYLLEPTVRLYDDKHVQVQAFDSYDVRHGMNFAAGLRVMYKIGPSYEEKLIKKTNPEIARLLASNVSNDIAERNAIRKQLAEDRALIAEQAALLKQLSQPVVLSAHVFSTPSSKMLPSKDEDLLQALDSHNDAFAAK